MEEMIIYSSKNFFLLYFSLITWYFMLLQISSSTVVHALDHITQQDTLVIGSLSKKKTQKKNSKSSPEEDINSGEFLSGEKAISFIAGLLDMLLLKKDLAHRFLKFNMLILACSL